MSSLTYIPVRGLLSIQYAGSCDRQMEISRRLDGTRLGAAAFTTKTLRSTHARSHNSWYMKILSLRQLPILCRLFFRRIAHDQIATAQDRQEI